MSLPQDIDPAKLLTLLGDFPLHVAQADDAAFFQRVSSMLEVSPLVLEGALAGLGTALAPLARRIRRSDNIFFDLEPILAAAKAPLETMAQQLAPHLGKGPSDQTAGRANRVPPAARRALLEVAFGRLELRMASPSEAPILLEIVEFCTALKQAAPTGFTAAAAAKILAPDTARDGFPDFTVDEHAALTVLGTIVEAMQHDTPSKLRRAVPLALDAWEGAFEAQIFDVCKFIRTVADHPEPPTFPTDRRGAPSKGNLFEASLGWCKRHDVPFPFRENLPTLRNAIAHRRHKTGAQEVTFYGRGDVVLERIPLRALVGEVYRDIIFATRLETGFSAAEVSIRDQCGDYDWPWAVATTHLPELHDLVRNTDPK